MRMGEHRPRLRPQKQTSDKHERGMCERQPQKGPGSGEWGREGIGVRAAEPGRSPEQNNKARCG